MGEYEKVGYLRPDFAPPLVNAAVAYSQLGDMPKAESALHRAIAAEPKEPSAHFNLGLLLAETGQTIRQKKNCAALSISTVERGGRVRSGSARREQES